jgi:hypothetical protein
MKRSGRLVVGNNVPNDDLKANIRPRQGRWSIQEKLLFSKGTLHVVKLAIQKHGKNWKLVKGEIPSRTTTQVRAHAQKFFNHIANVKPEDMDAVSYVRSVPAGSLVNVPLQNIPLEIHRSQFQFSSDLIPRESCSQHRSESIEEE